MRKKLFIALFSLPVIVIAVFLWLSSSYVVPIMMYHSVNDAGRSENLIPTYHHQSTGNTVSPQNFSKHMEYLKANRYNVISLEEFIDAIKTKRRLPFKSVVITFDDGYEDNYIYAFSELKKHQFPATIFVLVTTVGQKGWLSWDQIKEMEKQNISIGSHTVSHTYLPDGDEDKQRFEITESKKILEEKLGRVVNALAYPAGGFTEKTKEIARQAGYKGACTTNRGYDRLNKDLYEIKRIRFSNKDYPLSIWLKLSGFYNIFRSSKDPY
ncbi:MAG: polysaccharide deacetylase family protein [Candidatus Omnitrophota bacterium]